MRNAGVDLHSELGNVFLDRIVETELSILNKSRGPGSLKTREAGGNVKHGEPLG